MAPIMHRAAAAAREALLDRAAKRGRWSADARRRQRKITMVRQNRDIRYGELLKGRSSPVEIPAGIAGTPPGLTVAGASVPKVDGRAFVTGTGHAYTSDIAREA